MVLPVSFYQYYQEGYLSQEKELSQKFIIDLIRQLDILLGTKKLSKGIAIYLENNPYYDEDKIFKKIIQNESSFSEKLRFHAFYIGIERGKTENELLSWMRVIFNLTENSNIDSIDDYSKALQSINELARQDYDILDLLIKDKNINVKGFSQEQFYEEKLKAHLLTKSKDWSVSIVEFEKHSYFRGQIGFTLLFSGIVEFFNLHENTSWDDDKHYLEQFKYYANCASSVFTAIEKNSGNLDYSWERAVLSKGEYFTKSSADRFNLLSSRTTKNNVDRDHTWLKLLRINLAHPKKITKNQAFVKQVFDDADFDYNAPKISLAKIHNKYLEKEHLNWQSMLIEKKELFEICTQGFIVKNESEIVLLHESKRNHYHSDLYTKYLELKLRELNDNKKLFKEIKYTSVYGKDQKCKISLVLSTINHQELVLDIFHDFLFNGASLQKEYIIILFPKDRTKLFIDDITFRMINFGFKKLDDYTDQVKFKFQEYDNSYVLTCITPSDALKNIFEFCKELSEN